MRELRFERLSEDGSQLILADESGVLFEVPVDDALVSTIRRCAARTSVRNVPGAMTPRDIQALIRQGVTIEDVCARTGMDPDFVQRFAEPVMAEMDFVIQRARRLSVFDGRTAIPVEELVERAARRADVPTEELEWSCRKTAEATWRIEAAAGPALVVSLVFRVGEGTITPADEATDALLVNRPRQMVDLTDGSMPQHWDAQHPAARAAARQAQGPVPEPMQSWQSDDPSRIF